MRHYLPTEPEIHILGRTRKGTPLPLFWTASGLEFQTDAGELWFELESGYDVMEEWIRIEVDGFCLQRMMVPKGKSRLCAFRGFPAGSLRTVRLLKEVQPMRDDEGRFLLVHGLDCDGNLFPVPKKRCRIEFVGDSLSAGVGLGGAPSLIGAGPAVYGLDGNYALLAAEHFQAEQAELIVLAGFMTVLGDSFLRAFENRIINVSNSPIIVALSNFFINTLLK